MSCFPKMIATYLRLFKLVLEKAETSELRVKLSISCDPSLSITHNISELKKLKIKVII